MPFPRAVIPPTIAARSSVPELGCGPAERGQCSCPAHYMLQEVPWQGAALSQSTEGSWQGSSLTFPLSLEDSVISCLSWTQTQSHGEVWALLKPWLPSENRCFDSGHALGTCPFSSSFPRGRKELANLVLCPSIASSLGPGNGCLGNQVNFLLSALRIGRLKRLPEPGFCWILWWQEMLALVVQDTCCLSRN